eukprot:5713339-Prymnesium_polylepis.1
MMLKTTSHGRCTGNRSRNRSSQPPLEHEGGEGCVIPRLGWWCIDILAPRALARVGKDRVGA